MSKRATSRKRATPKAVGRNPRKGSFKRCVKAVKKRGGAKSPEAVCGKALSKFDKKKRNPNWSLRQGKAKAQVYETATHRHTAEVRAADGATERESFSGPKSFRSATSWARLRLHEVANPGVRVKVFPQGGRRKNPIDAATKLYEEFHGVPSEEIREYQEQEHRHSVLAGLGPLISIRVLNVQGTKEAEILAPDPIKAQLADCIMLCATEDGKQLMFTGGDQKLPIKVLEEKFGMTERDIRDHMLIGTITQVTYRTKKSFEKKGQVEIDFYHDLGGEGSKGILPVLVYKPRNPSIETFGGRYFIGKPEGSLGGVSPGLIG